MSTFTTALNSVPGERQRPGPTVQVAHPVPRQEGRPGEVRLRLLGRHAEPEKLHLVFPTLTKRGGAGGRFGDYLCVDCANLTYVSNGMGKLSVC